MLYSKCCLGYVLIGFILMFSMSGIISAWLSHICSYLYLTCQHFHHTNDTLSWCLVDQGLNLCWLYWFTSYKIGSIMKHSLNYYFYSFSISESESPFIPRSDLVLSALLKGMMAIGDPTDCQDHAWVIPTGVWARNLWITNHRTTRPTGFHKQNEIM